MLSLPGSPARASTATLDAVVSHSVSAIQTGAAFVVLDARYDSGVSHAIQHVADQHGGISFKHWEWQDPNTRYAGPSPALCSYPVFDEIGVLEQAEMLCATQQWVSREDKHNAVGTLLRLYEQMCPDVQPPRPLQVWAQAASQVDVGDRNYVGLSKLARHLNHLVNQPHSVWLEDKSTPDNTIRFSQQSKRFKFTVFTVSQHTTPHTALFLANMFLKCWSSHSVARCHQPAPGRIVFSVSRFYEANARQLFSPVTQQAGRVAVHYH